MRSFKLLLHKKWRFSLMHFITILISFYLPWEAAIHRCFFKIDATTKIGFLLCISMDWFLYGRGLCRERVKRLNIIPTAWKVSKYGVFSGAYFFRIRTEYGKILRISQYSVRMRENTDQKKLRIWTQFTQWQRYYTLYLSRESLAGIISNRHFNFYKQLFTAGF